jgi:hypothetical protein
VPDILSLHKQRACAELLYEASPGHGQTDSEHRSDVIR